LRPILKAHIEHASFLMTDEAGQYRNASEDFAKHETVNHGIEEYVRGDVPTNSAEGFFSILKRGITGYYFHVSEAHLHRYLSEFSFRHSNRSALGVEDLERADIAFKGAVGKRLTYQKAR
jgi:hypothetical protein